MLTPGMDDAGDLAGGMLTPGMDDAGDLAGACWPLEWMMPGIS